MRQWAQKDDFDLENKSGIFEWKSYLSVLQTSLASNRKLLTAQTIGRYWKSRIGNRESVPFPEFMWLGFGFTGCGSVIFSTFVRVMKISCLSCQAQPTLLRLQRTNVERLYKDLPKCDRSDHQALRRHPRGGVIVPETIQSKTFFCVQTSYINDTNLHTWLHAHSGWVWLRITEHDMNMLYCTCECILEWHSRPGKFPYGPMGILCGSVSGVCPGVSCASLLNYL